MKNSKGCKTEFNSEITVFDGKGEVLLDIIKCGDKVNGRIYLCPSCKKQEEATENMKRLMAMNGDNPYG